GDVRNVPAAKTDVVADPILRDAPQRVVERLDPELRPLPISLLTLLHQLVVHVRQHRIVDLQHETRIDDLQILLAEGVGDGEHVLALVLVVLVDGVVAGTGRGNGGQKAFLDALALERGLEIADVAADALDALIANRTDARVAGRTDGAPRKLGLHELAEPNAIATQPD